jgi:predicted deacylase
MAQWRWRVATAVLVGTLLGASGFAGQPSEGADLVGERMAAADGAKTPAPETWLGGHVAGQAVQPGSKLNASLRVSESFSGDGLDLPVLIARGAAPGLTLCLTAGVHGDELNGVEIVRRVFQAIDADELRGTVVGLPVVNVHGFRSSSRYLPDRRDLNRYFPGQPDGSSAARIAATLFATLIDTCDSLIDFHTGSFHRTNLPQVRGDLAVESVLALGRSFGVGVLVHNRGMRGTLRRAATTAGLPTVTYEAGEPMRFSEDEIAHGVNGVHNVLAAYGMRPTGQRARPPRIYHRSRWVRTNAGGIFLSPIDVGDAVREHQLLGTVTDPVSNHQTEIRAPFAGRVIGMAVPQVVIPGFAMFHIGLEGTRAPDDALGAEDLDDHDDAAAELDGVEQPE